MSKTSSTTFVVRDADGKKAGEQTVDEAFTPVLVAGQTAEVKEPEKPKPAEKPTVQDKPAG
jgi:hypothetical protein